MTTIQDKLFAFAVFALGAITPSEATEIKRIPCIEYPDAYVNIIDKDNNGRNESIVIFGGRNGYDLNQKYKKFIGFQKFMDYLQPGHRDPIAIGACQLLTR